MSSFIDRLQSMREHNRLEFKKATGSLPKSFWETYSSFANTEGGVIVLGADEGLDGYPVPTGIKDVEQVKKQLWDGLNNPQRASVNVLADSDVTTEVWEGKPLIVVNVPRADRRARPVYVGNNPKTGTYRRNGEGDYHVTEEAYLSLVRDSLRDPIDSVVLDEFTLEDLYDETVQAYRNRFESVRPKSPWVNASLEVFLMRIGAAGRSKEDHGIHPTRAGLLMFGEAWRIVHEFGHYFLDCRQVIDGNRWNNRIVSDNGEWSGNVFDFWFKASAMLAEGLPVPFRLRPDMIREDDTPQHRAVREALTNALVHADYFGKAGVVAIRRKNSIEVSNPGLLRISRELIEAGGISEARNETMLRIFSLVDIGERAGSGYDVLREGTYSAGKPDPVYTEIYDPERVKLTMELETSGLVEFRLPGMGGESSPLVTRVAPPRRDDENGETSDDPVTQSGGPVTQSGGPVTQSGDPVTQSGDPVARLLAALGDDDLSTSELMQRLGLEHKTYFRRTYLSPALDRGLIERAIPDKPNSRLQKYRKARR